MSSPKRVTKRFHLVLDVELVVLARDKLLETRGNENVSQLINEFLEDFIIGERRTTDPIKEEVKELAARKRREFLSQRKLIENEQIIHEEIVTSAETRKQAIHDAMIYILADHRNFEKLLPENDLEGDFIDELDAIADRVSQRAGYDLTVSDLIKAYKEWKRQFVVSQREQGAGSIRQDIPAPRHNTILNKEVKANEYPY